MAPRRSGDRPQQPWRPAKLVVSGPYKREQEVWAVNGRTGERVRKAKASFDVRYRVDGHEFRYSLDQKGWADDFAYRLKAGHAAGWQFDPASRQFVDPEQHKLEERQLTVFEHVREYVRRKWASWEPASRRNAQRDLARSCVELLRDDAPRLAGRDRVDADEYLRRVVLVASAPEVSENDRAWEDWFLRWSRPLAAITDQHLQDLVEAVRSTALDGSPRLLAPAASPASGRC